MDASSPREPAGEPVRLRATQVTRLEAFTDAAFAFAVTLLVIAAGALPSSVADLVDDLRRVPAFAASFAIVAFFWISHYRWSRRYGLETPTSTLLTLVLVLLVLVWVYPLRMIAATTFHWVSGGALAADFVIASVRDVVVMYVVYGLGFASLAAVLAALHAHALRQSERLELTPRERIATRGYLYEWLSIAVIGLVSVLIAVAIGLGTTRGGWHLAVPGLAYFLIGPATWLTESWSARARGALAA